MGNNAYLLNHDSPTPLGCDVDGRRKLLSAKNQIPILWLALFVEANIIQIEVPMRTSAGEKVLEQVPTLLATGFEWVNLYRLRRALAVP